jgi:hypothetical protein
MTILTDWNFTLSADDVLRGQGADPETVRAKKPALLKAASAALHAGFTKLRPAAVIQNIKVVEHRHERILLKGGKELTGPLVAHNLAGAEQVILAVCTIGSELEKLASSWMDENPLLGLALDGLGNAAVEKVAQQVCAHIAERAQAKGLQASTPLSPGEMDWPVEVGQPQIFALLNPSQAGVTLTSGGMMVPKKSISFVVGLGPEMARTDICEVCSLKETCRYRHA